VARRPEHVVGRVVVPAEHERAVGFDAAQAMDDEDAGAGLSVGDPVDDDLAGPVVVGGADVHEVAERVGRLHRMPAHDDERCCAAEAGRPQDHEEQGHRAGEQQRRDGATTAGSYATLLPDAGAGIWFDWLAHGESRWKSSHVIPVDVYW
jgi:hypothetical protein